jgi:hypothetical protein
MQITNQNRRRFYVIAIASVACAIVSCEAAGYFNRSFDPGRPRDLINHPNCMAFDERDELLGCEASADR